MRVALATAAARPELDEDGPALLAALAAVGIEAHVEIWDDPTVVWGSYDRVVVRSVWDYIGRPAEFLRWADDVAAVTSLHNPAAVLRWNTDKTYLRDLAVAGVAVVPTVFLPPGSPLPPTSGEYVLKPTVSAGSDETARYGDGERDTAEEHLARLHAAGRTAMLQPYLRSVDSDGETAVLYLGGAFSHGVRKGQILFAGQGVQAMILDKDEREQIVARTPSEAEHALASAALAAVPGGGADLLYARVDLVLDDAGAPLVLEVELAEPSLFLLHAPGAAERFAAALVALR